MANSKTKLELTWIGKEDRPRLEPRNLLEDPSKSYHAQHRLMSGNGVVEEERPEDYLVGGLIDFDDISYDDHADLLYKLAGQVVQYLRSYLGNEDEVLNILQYHKQILVNLIHAQMQTHYEEQATEYEAHVSRGFVTLRPNTYSTRANEQ